MDILSLLSGLAYLALIGTAWGLSSHLPPRGGWRSLGAFVGALAVHDLLGEPWVAIPEATILPTLSLLTLALAMFSLMEFARRAAIELGDARRGWGPMASLAMGALGFAHFGSVPLSFALWAVMGMPGALWGARGLWRMTARHPEMAYGLRWASAGLVLAAAGATLESLSPGHRVAGSGLVPILAASGQLGGTLLLAAGLWRCYWEVRHRDCPAVPRRLMRQQDSWLAAGLLLVLLGGWAGATQLADTQAQDRREELLRRIAVAAGMLTEDVLEELVSTPALSPTYVARQVEAQLGAVRQAEPGLLAGWLAVHQEATFSVLAGSPSPEPEEVPAGLPKWVHTALPHLRQPRPAQPFLIGPHADGERLTAVAGVPVREKRDATVWMLWQLDAGRWARQTMLARLPAAVGALLLGSLLLVFNAVWHHARLLSEARRRDLERTRRQEAAIAKLASSQMLAADSFSTAAAFITGVAAETQQVERVSIWLGGPRERRIRCVDLYQLTPRLHQAAPDIPAGDCPSYFEALSAAEVIVASDAVRDPRLRELVSAYLVPLNITALLDAPVFAEGKLAGVVCFEHVGTPRRWLEDEARFASEIADQVAFALVSARRHEAEAALAASEEHFREFVEFLPQIVFELDLTARFTFVNQAAYHLTGYSPEDVAAGLTPLDLCDPAHHETIRQNLADLLQGRSLPGAEYRMRRKDGSVFFGLAHTSVMQRGGVPVGYRGIVLDITERRRAELAATESQRRLAEIIDFLPDATLVVDRDRRVVLWNRAMELLTGVPSSQMVGRGDYEYALPFYGKRHPILIDLVTESEARLRTKYGNVRREGDNLVGEAFVPGLGQKGRHLWGVARPLYDGEGRFAGAIESIRDVSARRRAEEALRQTHTELARTCESMKDLLQKQTVDIHLAHQTLWLINSSPPRHVPLREGASLFISSLFVPCHAAGGDHFFVRTLGDREAEGTRTILSLKDQSGHEVGCILRSIVTDLMHNALLHGEPRLGLAEIVTRLNREVQSSGFFRNGDFFTSINLALDHDTRELEFLSAGHPPILLIRGSQVLALPAENGAGANLPLGLLGEIGFQAGRCQLQPGDKLLCYTDGLYEVPSPLGRPALTTPDFQQMVADLAAAAPEASVSELVRRVLDRIGLSGDGTGRLPQGLPDDVALLGLELEPPAEVQEWSLRPQTGDELNRLIVEAYERQREEWLKRGFEQPDNRLRIVLEEALLNAWHHGNACNPQKTITLRRWYGNDATFEVTDEGAGFDPAAARDPRSFENLARPSGRGLHLIRLLSTEAQWLQGGRRLRASFARHDSPALKPKRQPVRQPMDLWQAPGWKAAPGPQ